MVTDMSIPWEQEQPLSWPAFLNALEQYCESRGWMVEYSEVGDCSCAIFACPEKEDDEAIGALDFVQDELPF